MIERTIDFMVERDEEEIELQVTGYIEPFIRGRLSGAPEDCFPDEGGVAEIKDVKLGGKIWEGELTKAEVESAESDLYVAWQDDAEEPDPPSGRDDE